MIGRVRRSVHALRRRLLALAGWQTRGVKVMVYNGDGALLLIRNAYGDTRHWVLPGGGVRRREEPQVAAVREVREETGCAISMVEPIEVYVATTEGRRDTVFLFRARTGDRPVPDGREVTDARFVALDALPEMVSPATRRRIAEERDGVRSDRW